MFRRLKKRFLVFLLIFLRLCRKTDQVKVIELSITYNFYRRSIFPRSCKEPDFTPIKIIHLHAHSYACHLPWYSRILPLFN